VGEFEAPTRNGFSGPDRGRSRHAYGLPPREELFDLEKDSRRMHNVADDPAYAKVVAKLRQQLMAELKRTGDPRPA
jgi:hypothetical protein